MATKTAKQKAQRNARDRARRARARTPERLAETHAKRSAAARNTVTPERRAQMAEQARKQWAENSILRAAQKAGKFLTRYVPPANAPEIIEYLVAEYGSTQEMLASHFHVNPLTFARWLREYPDMRAAFERSKGIEHSKLIGVLYQQAMAGSTVAAIVLLKFRHGYRDSGPVTGPGEDSAVQKAEKIRAALREIQRVDGELGGNEDVHFGGDYTPYK